MGCYHYLYASSLVPENSTTLYQMFHIELLGLSNTSIMHYRIHLPIDAINFPALYTFKSHFRNYFRELNKYFNCYIYCMYVNKVIIM